MTSVERYEGWLRVVAQGFGDSSNAGWETQDLIQEGRVAMWRQEKSLGREHAGFMTQRAAGRMGEVASGGSALGSGVQGRSGRSLRNVGVLDEVSEKSVVEGTVEDIAERAMWAYHSGQIWAEVESLPPKQREAVRVFLRDGAMTPSQQTLWIVARKKLRVALERLWDE